MNFIERVGNLKLYYRMNDNIFGDETITIYAVNGSDIVKSDVYTGRNYKNAAEHLLYRDFDTCTLETIRAGLPEIISEYGGRLLYGKIAGFDRVDYFKRIDNTRFYKHFTKRPAM